MAAENKIRSLEEMVHHAIREPRCAVAISEARQQADRVLRENPDEPAAIAPIDINAFGHALPSAIRSCRLSIMRGGSIYPIERHPGAEQFVFALENSGTIRTFDGEHWHTDQVASEPMKPDVRRLHRVPENVWHQPIPGARDWVVLGFHTATAGELVDDFAFEGPNPAPPG